MRVYGYYVLPILQGEFINGRCDLKTNRQRGSVAIKGLWWEDGKPASRQRLRLFEEAIGKLEEHVLESGERG